MLEKMNNISTQPLDDSVPVCKKRKCDNECNEAEKDGDSSSAVVPFSFAFSDFKLVKVLREDARGKLVTLHGTVGDKDAVVVLERKAFDIPVLEECLQQTTVKETLQNDVYSTFDVYSSGSIAHMKATLIHPATEKHISKYSDREPFIVRETPELYRSVVLPSIQENKFSFQWVYNILEKKTESERIVAEDPDPEVGFVMVPDMKWNRENVESLYLIAIVHRRGIRSIRDLRQEHLPLLENILNKGLAAIEEKFSVKADKLRIYFHYQPSYYHLHVHFTHVKFEAPGTDALRAHLLEDVIDNIKMNSEFYNLKTLSYIVREHDALYYAFQDKKYFV
ncbi:unnamed protein product [Candidula unifasciata]|uniref:m7GpppX diphosphatase n=1 Tax=Candidula unifasciata TaxID=100452 RepID=A0A8S3YTF9_9EUPU|nr:unnamed protein product [Candidula unifasciata]